MKLSLGSHTGWSCSFDESNPSCLWIGGSAGIVMLFDIRKLGGRVISSVCPYDSACLAAYQLASTSNISNECIPNLIPAQSTCGSSLNLTYPPIQSIVHSSSRPFGSSLDHLMICQGGHCRFVRIENHLSSITSSFVSLRNGMPVSVYDTQRWTHPYLERSCNYVLACRSHLLSGENRTQLPHPALRSISFDPVKQTIDHSTQQKVPIFDEGVTLTGHTLSTSGAKPHSTFVGYQFIKPLLPPDIEESNGNLDSGLMVACPNETHQSVFISVIAGNSTHQMDV